MKNLQQIQNRLQAEKLDGWLFFDHHVRDPIAYRVLGLDTPQHVSRRWYYWIPAQGDPRKLVHRIEDWMLDPLPGERSEYSRLAAATPGARRHPLRRETSGHAVLARLHDSLRLAR